MMNREGLEGSLYKCNEKEGFISSSLHLVIVSEYSLANVNSWRVKPHEMYVIFNDFICAHILSKSPLTG